MILSCVSLAELATADEPVSPSAVTAPQKFSPDLLRRQLYARTIESAWQSWQRGEISRARELLQTTAPELRSWEFDYLTREFDDSSRIYEVSSYGKPSGIRYVTFSPDGSLLAASANDLRIKVWDFEQNELLFDERDETRTVEFSPTGQHLLTGLSSTVTIRDSRSGKIVDRLRISNSGIAGIPLYSQFSPDGNTIAVQNSHRGVQLIDTVSGQDKFYFKDHRFTYNFRFDPAGGRLALVTQDFDKEFEHHLQLGIELYDLTGNKPALIKTIDVQNLHSLRSLDFSPDGRRMAVCGSLFSRLGQGQCSVFDSRTGNTLFVLREYQSNLSCVRFSADGKQLATGSLDGTVRLWDGRDGTCLHTFRGHTSQVRSVAFRPDGRTLASGSDDGTIRIWDLDETRRRGQLFPRISTSLNATLTTDGQRGYLPWRSYDRENQYYLRELRITEIKSGESLPPVQLNPKFEMISFAESRGGELLARSLRRSAHSLQNQPDPFLSKEDFVKGTVRITNRSTGEVVSEIECPRPPRAIGFSPDGAILYSVAHIARPSDSPSDSAASSSGFVIAGWEVATGNPLFQETIDADVTLGYVAQVKVSPDGKRLTTLAAEKVGPNKWKTLIYLFDALTGEKVGELAEVDNSTVSCQFSPDSRLLAVAVQRDYSQEFRGYLSVWDLKRRQKTLTIPAHRTQIHSVRFTPDGRRVVSAGAGSDVEGGEVSFWDPATGERVLQLDDFSSPVTRLAFDAADRALVAVENNGTVSILEAE